MEPLASWFVFIFGAVVGSFLNVCIFRMPRDLSIVRPRSFCPECKKQIVWYENVPLISFLLLRGKCSHCRKEISPRYFFVELANALLWLFLWRRYGLSLEFGIAAFFFSLLLVIIMTDFETGLIPDKITIPGMIAGLVFSAIGYDHFPQGLWYQRLLASALGLLAGGGMLLLTGWFGQLMFRKESMGGGDVKLLAMIGAFVGLKDAFFVFLLAPFPALPLALWQRLIKKEETIPYGPFLALLGAFLFIESETVFNLLTKIYGI